MNKTILNVKNLSLIFYMAIIFSCHQAIEEQPNQTQLKPNILWLVAEDMSPNIPPFGDSTVQTPNLSRLAAEGIRYTNVCSVSGVCAPSRSALCTGMYPTSMGTHHMRTTRQTENARKIHGLIDYECVIPPDVKMVSEIMRKNGYYCTNNSKTDYQFRASLMAWDESSNYAHWRNRPDGKPFYSVFNFGVTHEGQQWAPAPAQNIRYGRDTFPPARNQKFERVRYNEAERKPWLVPKDLEVNIPPYLPETKIVRNDVRQMYSNIVELDQYIGVILKQLEEDGLLDNTIIVCYTDHGGPLPRQKRLLYDSGLNVPMIIRYPDKMRAGEVDDQLISFIDFAPTLLSMADIEPPEYIQGQAFEGKYKAPEKRQYIHAAADRFDECYDMKRAVRDKQFKYLKNFQPEKPYYLPLAYRERMATMQEMLRLRNEEKLNEIQMQWFRDSKPEEELFDVDNDPHELKNLADQPQYAEKLQELRAECKRWMQAIDDKGLLPENDLIESFWPGKVQPKTASPIVKNEMGKITVSCSTEGASIGFKIGDQDKAWLGWNIYKEPFTLTKGERIKIVAHRIGYLPSDTLILIN